MSDSVNSVTNELDPLTLRDSNPTSLDTTPERFDRDDVDQEALKNEALTICGQLVIDILEDKPMAEHLEHICSQAQVLMDMIKDWDQDDTAALFTAAAKDRIPFWLKTYDVSQEFAKKFAEENVCQALNSKVSHLTGGAGLEGTAANQFFNVVSTHLGAYKRCNPFFKLTTLVPVQRKVSSPVRSPRQLSPTGPSSVVVTYRLRIKIHNPYRKSNHRHPQLQPGQQKPRKPQAVSSAYPAFA